MCLDVDVGHGRNERIKKKKTQLCAWTMTNNNGGQCPSVRDKPTTGPARVTLDPTAPPPLSPTSSAEDGRRFYNSTIYNYYLLGEPNLVPACVCMWYVTKYEQWYYYYYYYKQQRRRVWTGTERNGYSSGRRHIIKQSCIPYHVWESRLCGILFIHADYVSKSYSFSKRGLYDVPRAISEQTVGTRLVNNREK